MTAFCHAGDIVGGPGTDGGQFVISTESSQPPVSFHKGKGSAIQADPGLFDAKSEDTGKLNFFGGLIFCSIAVASLLLLFIGLRMAPPGSQKKIRRRKSEESEFVVGLQKPIKLSSPKAAEEKPRRLISPDLGVERLGEIRKRRK